MAVIRPANVMFEVDGVTEAIAREAMRLGGNKTADQHQIYFTSPRWIIMKMSRIKRFDSEQN